MNLLGPAALVLLLALGGFAPAGAEPREGEGRTAEVLSPTERARLVEAFNRWAAGLRTVKAGGKARVGGEGEKTRMFQFSLVLARPGSARLQGRWGSLASLFDLSGSAEGWTLYLPQDRAVVRAARGADAGLLLPPLETLAVLLPPGIPPRDLERDGAASREGELARFVVPPGKGGAGSEFHRVLWLNLTDGTPRRLEIRRGSQLEPVVLTAEYGRYEGKGPEAFPAEVSVEMAESAQWAKFNFETVRLNSEAAASLFRINVPAGTREIPPEELTPDFLPVEEAP